MEGVVLLLLVMIMRIAELNLTKFKILCGGAAKEKVCGRKERSRDMKSTRAPHFRDQLRLLGSERNINTTWSVLTCLL